jgi:DNA-binding CsgD family transcriptional regulator
MANAPETRTVSELAREAVAAGERIGLPYVAGSPDIGSPAPLVGDDGRPLAVTLFRWLDPDLRYWEDRGFALRSAFAHAARTCAEPFYFADGMLGSWRPNPALEVINRAPPFDRMGVESAIVAPAYLPGGVIGALVWASPERLAELPAIFAREAAGLHALALRLIGTHADAAAAGEAADAARLTRREIQCLKWAASGKTDQEIGQIVQISAPTVRFHLTNAARKLQASGRSQAIHRAASLGYIGRGGAPARAD